VHNTEATRRILFGLITVVLAFDGFCQSLPEPRMAFLDNIT
jgi:hypothetical protein